MYHQTMEVDMPVTGENVWHWRPHVVLKLFLGYIQIYLHFLQLLNIKVVEVVERQRPEYPTNLI